MIQCYATISTKRNNNNVTIVQIRVLSNVIGENSVYPIVKPTIFAAQAPYNVTHAQRVSQNHAT